jgi:alpha-L-rhamnosidase
MKRLVLHSFLLVLTFPAAAAGWIKHPDAQAPVVLEFQREWRVERVPRTLPVTVTADPRYLLFVNGFRVGSGPSTGTIARWREAEFDLATFLKPGDNTISVRVWNFGDLAPLAQQTQATGFRLTGGDIGTDAPGWRVRTLPGHKALSGSEQHKPEYYVASAPEVIDARLPPGEWVEAVPAPAAERVLIRDPLPPQAFYPAAVGELVRSSSPVKLTPAGAFQVPANTHVKLLLRRDVMISAYPVFQVRGGRDARIRVTYAEALYDSPRKKVDRDLVGDRPIAGLHDEFLADGRDRRFETLWWRTWRYQEIEITTKDEPIVVKPFVYGTGYPFRQVGRFVSDDMELNRIFDVGWRTLRVDAHETFMDSSYWEQLQYAGDTRIEMLISYAMSGDPRLGEQAIDAFAESNVEGGIMEGAFPTRGRNTITTFSLAWIAMLHDWYWQQPDPAPIRRHLPRSREVLAWFARLRTPSGLLGANPHWNFIDWAGQRWDDRTVFPSYGKNGGSCLMTALWLGALRQAAELESVHGDTTIAGAHLEQAIGARRAIREHCWDESRGLFADNPDRNVFSQHMNLLAALYDVIPAEQARDVLDRIVEPARGIDAPDGMFTTTYYFAWYLVRAFEHAGLADRYHDLLTTWRELLKLNYTTWPESRGDTRSDTHAWSAHPTADLLTLVAGIRSDAPGYARVRVEPALGGLRFLRASAATPLGPVSVAYEIRKGKLHVEIRKPGRLPGVFIWRGVRYPLDLTRTRLALEMEDVDID